MAENQSRDLALRLVPQNFARALVVEQFIDCVTASIDWKKLPQLSVTVVGGSNDEPEIAALRELGFEVKVSVVGIDSPDSFVDLNGKPGAAAAGYPLGDLVLCSQVIEHVWHHRHFFEWLVRLTSEKSYLWLAAPAANRPHGSPGYFSAGFTSEYLANNLEANGMRVQGNGMVGTTRLYYAALTSPFWLSVFGHRLPPFTEISVDSRWKRFALRLRYAPMTIRLMFCSPEVRFDLRYATESWAWALGRDGT